MRDKKMVIIGGGSGIARRLAADAAEAGATVVLAGREPRTLDLSGVTTARVDLGDEDSIRALAAQVGSWDHLVSLAANHANGPVTALAREAITSAFDAKVIGPLLLAKHFAPAARDGGSILLFSGFAAWRPAPGLSVMATTNGAVGHLAEALAVELAPVRVNALSPGIVDSGSWDRLGADRDAFFADTAARNPARRVGRPADIASAALLTLANPFLTGSTVHVDGGGRLV
ncbi:SDR family oxidoreductase [Amycolatopsis orientalis]|uniref:SDR family oxidoreductase n=1 Tax=Amycolatopsis orientalis TaxID=31958 RepID=UPI001F2FCF2F|nr:SDR family oxidoreductase [Amycolatopsis orientalis]